MLSWLKANKTSHKSNLQKLQYEGAIGTLTGTQRQIVHHTMSLNGAVSHLGLTGSINN